MNHGFVYVLQNDAMPGIYKVGFTLRSPSLRCHELSQSTSAPMPFNLVCYAEYENAANREQQIHAALSAYRVSESREFFQCDLKLIVGLVIDLPRCLSYCDRHLGYFLETEGPRTRAIRPINPRHPDSSSGMSSRGLD
jgi:hypothetical protein